MKLTIPASIASLQDLSALSVEIHAYSQYHRHEAIKSRVSEAPVKNEPPILSPAATELINQWKDGDLDDLERALADYGKTAKTITITLAAPPTGTTKRALVDWVRKNLDESILVEVQFNSTLLGGLVVRAGSHIYDWSFRSRLLARDIQFSEVLNRV